ncbi:hypothetical protein [Streptomyces sp. HUAS ZL42]
MDALPKKSARELRALVAPLDDRILRRAKVIQVDDLGAPWWRDQL